MKSLRSSFLTIFAFFTFTLQAQNYAVSFDGTDDYISIPSTIFSSAVTNFTIECWIKPNSGSFNNAYHGIIGFQQGSSATSDRNPGMWVNNGMLHYDMYQPTTNTRYTGNSAAVIVQDKWNHVAMVKSGTSLFIYINGKLEVSTTVSSTVKVIGNYNIGYIDNNFAGLIDEVRFWSVARSQQQIVSTLFESPAYNATGLVAYYKLNSTSGTTATNSCTNTSSINGTLNNGPTWNAASSLSFSANSMNLGASTDYLQADITSAGSNKMTIEGWVKFNSLTNQQNFFGMYQSLGATSYCRAIPFKNSSNYLDFYLANTAGTASFVTTSYTVSANTWYHLAFVYDNQKAYVYVNGVLQASNTSTVAFSMDGADVFVIGNDRSNNNVGFNSDVAVDEVRVWTTARTASEILEYYDKYVPPSTSGLVAYYSFDHGNPSNSNTDFNQVYNQLNNGNLLMNNVTLSSSTSNFIAQPSTISSNYLWNGNTSTAFNTASNWAEETVPPTNAHIEIAASTLYSPTLDQNRTLGDIILPSGTIFTLGNNTLTIDGKVTGTGTFKCSTTSSISYTGSNSTSTLYFDQTTNKTTNALYNLTLNPGSNGVVTIGNTLYINNLLNAPWGTLNTGDNITLRSTSTSTAMTGDMSDMPTINGNVTVERYIPGRRAFRLISSPVSTSTTIYSNWQEGGSSASGYGTHITGSTTGSNGFDASITGNPSLFTFDNSAGSWSAVTSTNNATNDKLTAGNPYRLLVRGDRTISLANNAPSATNTTLRATGNLYVGSKTYSGLNTTSGAFSLIGNPYQSAVNMGTLLTSTLLNTNLNTVYYYIWDPTVGTRGAYVTVDVVNNTNNVSGSAANKYLQPWQSCFVKTKNSGAASLTFVEFAKNTTSSATWRESFDVPRMTLNLYQTDSFKNAAMPLDGLQVRFGNQYNSEIDDFDAEKPWNQDENFSILTNGLKLSIECKEFPSLLNDTIQLLLEQTRHTEYTVICNPINTQGYGFFLRDDFIGRSIPLANNELTQYSFTIDPQNDASKSPNRLKIISNSNQSGLNHLNQFSLRIYPNPSNGKFSIETAENMNMVKLYSLSGQLVLFKEVQNKNRLEMEALNNGLYLIEVSLENGTVQRMKFVQQ